MPIRPLLSAAKNIGHILKFTAAIRGKLLHLKTLSVRGPELWVQINHETLRSVWDYELQFALHCCNWFSAFVLHDNNCSHFRFATNFSRTIPFIRTCWQNMIQKKFHRERERETWQTSSCNLYWKVLWKNYFLVV